MNEKSRRNEIMFAILVGIILTAAIWWVVGGWIMPLVFCGFDNDKQCNSVLVSNISVVLSILIAGLVTTLKVRKILKK